MKYEIGSVIEYIAGGGFKRIVKVTAKYENMGVDRPGFDGTLLNDEQTATSYGYLKAGEKVWGYDSQITRLVGGAK